MLNGLQNHYFFVRKPQNETVIKSHMSMIIMSGFVHLMIQQGVIFSLTVLIMTVYLYAWIEFLMRWYLLHTIRTVIRQLKI